MNARDRHTLRRMMRFFENVYNGRNAWLTRHEEGPSAIYTEPDDGISASEAMRALQAVSLLMVEDDPLFRIDLDCGCTMRLFIELPPKVTKRHDHPDDVCALRRFVFVAE